MHKHYGDSFEDTDLESLLAEHQVGRLVVTGAQTDACIRSTLHGALVRGYDVTLVEDAHTTEDLRQWGVPLRPSRSSPTPTSTGRGPTHPAARATCGPPRTSTSPRADPASGWERSKPGEATP